jgi:hypothetical protein
VDFKRIVSAAVVLIVGSAMHAPAFELVEANLDLRESLGRASETGEPARPLFNELVVADLTGGGSREIVVPDTAGLIHLFRLAGSRDRPALELWTTATTRAPGDAMVGSCYLTAVPLRQGAPSSLLLALPRGIFAVQIEGEPPETRWESYCDRTFFDPGQLSFRPRRLDFAVDLDGDDTPELWLPELDGMTFLRRRADGSGWDSIAMPPLVPQVWQSAGAFDSDSQRTTARPQALRFHKSLRFPRLQLVDLDADGRQELLAVRSRADQQPPMVRAECYTLRDALHFTSVPTQVCETPVRDGSRRFVDLDGDGWLDLLRVESNLDIVTPRTVVEVFMSSGTRTVRFARPTYRYATHDPIGMVLYGDWNGDDAADLLYSQFDYAFGSTDDLIDLILGKELSVKLRLLYGRPGRQELQHKQDVHLRIRNRCFHHRFFPPVSMDGDFNADGMADLLARTDLDEVEVYLSTDEGLLGARAAATLDIPEESLYRIVDLDGDGRSDLLVLDDERPAIRVYLSRP